MQMTFFSFYGYSPSEQKNVLRSFLRIPTTLLVGSGYNASCSVFQWLETVADCNKVREDVARLIYLYLGKHEIFSAFRC